jgi:hypothetical protein
MQVSKVCYKNKAEEASIFSLSKIVIEAGFDIHRALC